MTISTAEQNALTYKPSDMAFFLSRTISKRLPILITGKPGIGKTDVVKQSAAASQNQIIVKHPVISDPTDYKGMPWVSEGRAQFLPFADLEELMNATVPTVCFFDDIGQAPVSVQAALMQLFLAREINGKAISEHVTFIGATNRRADRAGVSGILEPVKSRFVSIVELEVDVNDWCKWAIVNGVAPAVIAYIRMRPGFLCDFKPTSDLKNSPSPRTWNHLANLVSLDLPNRMRMTAYAGAVGESCAAEFTSFERTWQSMISPDAVLANPNAAQIPTEPSALYALATALAMRVTKDSMSRYVTYIDRLMSAGLAEFAAVSMQTAVTRDQNLANTGAYINAMAGQLGQLMIGEA